MKRLVLAAILVVVLAGGYYFRGAIFDQATSAAPPDILANAWQYVRGLFGGAASDNRTAARPAPAQLVVGDVASESAAPIQVIAIGTVQPIAMVQIKSRMDGEIASVNFEEGQEVKEGATLFTLDDRALKAQLQQAEANLERDRAQLERAKLE